MANREEALRRIFEGTGAGARLTEEQKRELLAHLDDAVAAKVDAGVAEMEAVGQAFAELGSLKKLASQFPAEAPALAIAGGGLIRTWIGGTAAMGYLLLLFFTFVQMVITPALLRVFVEVKIPRPGLTVVFATLSDWMRSCWPVVGVAFVALAVLLARVPRRGKGWAILHLSMAIVPAALLAGVLAAVILPIVSLLEGIALRR